MSRATSSASAGCRDAGSSSGAGTPAVLAVGQPLSGDELHQQHAQRVGVALGRGPRFVVGRHIGRLALGLIPAAAQAESRQQGGAVGGEQHVLGPDIAVVDPTAMRARERVGDLHGNLEHRLEGQRGLAHEGCQRRALHRFRNQVQIVARRFQPEHPVNVGVLQVHQRVRLLP